MASIWRSMLPLSCRRKHTFDNPCARILKTLCKNSQLKEALEILNGAEQTVDSSIYVSFLEQCIKRKALAEGKLLHNHMKRKNVSHVFLGNKLINMFGKCGSIKDAIMVFEQMPRKDEFSWTAMISAFVRIGLNKEALELFYQMRENGLIPNEFTISCILRACGRLGLLETGKEIHEEIMRCGILSDVVVGNALIDMYGKCGVFEFALQVFEKMPRRDVVSWTALIAGYVHNGQAERALKMYYQMKSANVKPNVKTLTSVLAACADLAALEQGKEMHDEMKSSGFEFDVFVESALVDMYAKCGDLKKAREVFDKTPIRNKVCWTAMIGAYAIHGCGKEAVRLFQKMRRDGVSPDHVTFVGVLAACYHSGLVEEGQQIFGSMSEFPHIVPAMEHYGCMVGLLGRAGRLDEARDIINKMPFKADTIVWGSLLGACRIHRDVKLGEHAAEHIFELGCEDPGPYVVLSNMYAEAGKWDGIERVRKMMKERNVKKKPGCSWIEYDKQVHTFVVGDRSHPQTEDIYALLEKLSRHMKEAGYVADRKFILNDVEEEQKEELLLHHSEKLAIAFGIINIGPQKTIRVIKNLRVCGDCHSAIKFISKVVAGEILVRDVSRFHHFKDGQCSCGDYW